MEYNDQRAIYLQIADAICEKVLTDSWEQDQRIPSVRELAADFQPQYCNAYLQFFTTNRNNL